MAQTIKLKRTATPSNVPTTAQLQLGEIAVNTYDGNVYIKKNDGADAIVKINANPSDLNYFINGAGTVAGTWLATDPDITSYYDGLVVWYRIGVAGASTTTLNINGLGAKTVYRYNTAKLTTHWPVNSVIPLVYVAALNGGSFIGGYDWSDGTQSYDLRWSSSVVNGSSIIHGYQLLMEGADTKFYPVTVGGVANSTTNVVQTAPLRIGGQMLYYNTTTDVAINAVIPDNVLYESIESGEGEYWMNRSSSSSWTSAGLPLYIVGTVNANNELILDNSTTTAFLTNALPTTEDGKIYIHIGYSDNEDDLWRLSVTHPIFEFKAGAIRRYTPALIPSEVLTAIKTVDGSSSGLDADLLDGIEAVSFLRSDASDTATGNLSFNGQLYFNSNSNSNYTEGVRLNLSTGGWGGAVIGGIRNSINGISNAWWLARNPSQDFVIAFGTSADSGGLHLPSGTTALKYKNNAIWHAGNDGSGSTLDADLLDGQQGSYYAPASHNHSGVYLPIGGKAADSELLDGIDSSSFLRSDATDTATGAITLSSTSNHFSGHHYFDSFDVNGNHYPHYLSGSSNNGAQVNLRVQQSGGSGYDVLYIPNGSNNITWRGNNVWNAGNDGSGSGLDADLLDGIDSTRVIYGSNSSGTNEGNISDWNAISKTGFYSHSAATNRWSSAVNWSSVLHFKLYDDNNSYSSQMGFNTYDNRMYARTNSAGVWTGWDEFWTSGNDGSGSGLDADLLDGQQGSYYAPNSSLANYLPLAGGTLTGDLLTSHTSSTPIQVTRTTGTNINIKYASQNGTTYIGQGATSGTMRIGTTADLIGAGNEVWHYGNLPTTSVANWNTAYGWGDHSTQSYATQAYVGTAISNLVDSSPATLNTLNELAAALGDDPNFATTVTNSIATKLPLTGGTLTGVLTTDDIVVPATKTIKFGASATPTFSISSSGTGTVLHEQGAGNFEFIGDNMIFRNPGAGSDIDYYAKFTYNGAAELYFDGTKTFETTATGIAVTGVIGASGTVTAPTFNATSTASGGFQGIDADTITAPSFTWTSDLDTGMWHSADNAIGFTTGGVNRITINSSGISGAGSGLTALNGSNISTGTVAAARVATLNQNTTGSSGSCTGNSATASAFNGTRTVSLTGDVTGSTTTWTGSGALSIATTIAANSVALGTDTTGNYVAGITAGSGMVVTGTAGEGWSPTVGLAALDLTLFPTSNYKKSVRVATTANITLSGVQTIDAIVLVAGNRVLVKNQTTASQNGIYIVAAGAWTRSTAADGSTEIDSAVVGVESGNVNGGLFFTNVFKSTDVLNTTAMPWYKVTTDLDQSTTNVGNKIVQRDASGNFSASTITATAFSGSGASLSALNGSNITTGTVAAARVATLNQSTTGNAATATALQTARTINGTSFNGTANITVEPYIEDDEGTDATRLLVFTDDTTAGFKRLNEDSGLTYNPLNNLLRSNSINASNFYVGTATTGAYITSPFTLGNLGLNAGSTAYNVFIGAGATNYAQFSNTLITHYSRLYSAPNTSQTASTPNFESRAQGSGNGVVQYHMSFTNSTGVVNGRITTNNFGTTYATTSDYRVKEDLQEMEDATSRLLELKPINFKWVGSENRTDGFLAHEVKEIVHDAVVGEKDATETVVEIVVDEEGNETEVTKVVDSLQALDQAKLIPLLVKTIQELEARIKLLESK
jgi:hypothetical protein